jgi:serine/threonine protein kinase/Flp pilus assembly protein TadD
MSNPAAPTDKASSAEQDSWISQEVRAMALAWSRGQRVSAEELFARYPALDDEAAIRLIFEEVCLRRESGEDIATAEIVNRFPEWKDELEVLLGCDRMLRPLARVASFPSAGEDLGSFRLLAELGRGACGRTYLAAEPALLDRLVVLKVISDDQEEHLSLARLQHTHIIPLFSEQTFAERGLRALCMPYLGGASLARILDSIAEVQLGERTGRHILDVLDRVQARPLASRNADGPYRRYLVQASYVQAVCWIAACLADALSSAHAHALVHMDVKPSNVLIAGDGLPMLLDFHLAHRPIRSGELIADRLGGTRGWMAPEHRAALEAVQQGQSVPQAVDHRADLYALGLLIKEALAGPAAAHDATAGQPWRRRNPGVSVGLADVVDKCLAAQPSERYADAAGLAGDLRRQLSDLPLRGVPNRSLAESWQKWRRRRPADLTRAIAWAITCAALILVLVLVQASYRERVRDIETALEDGRNLRTSGHSVEAAHTLGRALNRARSIPATQQLTRALELELLRARRGQQAAALHELAELVRFRYGIDLPKATEALVLTESISTIWKERDLLLATAAATLDSNTEKGIKTDLLDLVATWAELRAGLAPAADREAARHDALNILDEVSLACGSSPRVHRLRRTIAEASPPDLPFPHNPAALSPLDHYDLGRAYLRAARFREAAQEFQHVLDQRPQDFWPNFYQGVCAYRLGQLHEARASFRTCIALEPRSAECYYNRARVAEALGRIDLAVRDYGRAVELDPSLTTGFLNRGALAYRDGRHDAAIADFLTALRTTSDDRTLGLVHYNLALAYVARGDHARALASAQEALARGNDLARDLRDRLRREP